MALMPTMTHAEEYQLQQVISGPPCPYTTFEKAKQGVNDLSCASFDPIIGTIAVKETKVTVDGAYDAVHTTQLSVEFNGVVYVAGVSTELTVQQSYWRLNIARPTQAGIYPVIVMSRDMSGNTRTTTTEIEITSNAMKGKGIFASAYGMLAETGMSATAIIHMSIFVLITGAFVWRMQKRRRTM